VGPFRSGKVGNGRPVSVVVAGGLHSANPAETLGGKEIDKKKLEGVNNGVSTNPRGRPYPRGYKDQNKLKGTLSRA